ncbi:MAG: DUF938 domain-containing protein [Halieaceae bacterium]
MTKRFSPATDRNREPLLSVLRAHLPGTGTVLEVASGTGQHAVFFAPQLTPRLWLATDCSSANVASIASWCADMPSPNLLEPQRLDVLDDNWPVEQCALPEPLSAVVNINMIHIAPWACCVALFRGAARILNVGGVVLLYGPFKQKNVRIAPSNEAFDQQLKAQDPQWGIRELEAVVAVANQAGFECRDVISMPANNLSVVFHRAEGAPE